MRLWVSAGGAVSPLHYDAAGSFLAQAIILTMAICSPHAGYHTYYGHMLTTQATILTMAICLPHAGYYTHYGHMLTTQATILTMAICLPRRLLYLLWPYAHRGSDLAQLPQRPCSLVITP